MTEDNAGDQPQKTVAELLAQHGAQPEGGRRRRRRAADDDDDEQPVVPQPKASGGSRRKPEPTDTGSQAIIDRVTADGGTPPARRAGGSRRAPETPPPPPAQAPQPPQQPMPRRAPSHESGHFARPPMPPPAQPPQESGQLPRPVQPPPAPQESAQLPLPPRGRAPRQPQPPPPVAPGRVPPAAARTRVVPPAQPPVAPPPGPLAARLDGLEAPQADQDAGPGPMGSGYQAPPRPPVRRQPARRPMPPKQEDHTEQFAAVVDDVPPEPKPKPVEKPPVLDGPPAGLASWRKQRNKVAMDDTEIGVMPPLAEPDEALLDSNGQRTRFVPPAPPFAPARATPPPPAPDRGRLDVDTAFHQSVDDDLDDDEYEYDDQVDGYEREFDDVDDDLVEEEELEPEHVEASPAKQWLMLGAQLALGVVGGAAVWLGFNWLWVRLPAAALIAALLVVVALVWIVRKIRRAEDLQTTVLAVLVGLVVTVSPAALLLVSR